MTLAIAFLFFVSGLVALLYEVLWIREIGYVLGASSSAVATVVAAYLTGLAAGAWFAGRKKWGRRHGLLVYARLELMIACVAPAVPFMLGLVDTVLLDPLWPFLSENGLVGLVRFVVVFGLLVLPTALMGATLPVLCTTLSKNLERPGVIIGRLYGLNTLGGMVGCLVAGFWFIENLGLNASMAVAAGVNLCLMVAAWRLHRRMIAAEPVPDSAASSAGADEEEATQIASSHPSDEPAVDGAGADDGALLPAVILPRRLILIGVFVTSLASIAIEMLWTRLLALTIGGTTYAFALVLATFLFGLGLGALGVGWLGRRMRLGPGLLGFSQILLGLFVLMTMGSYDEWLLVVGMRIHEAGTGFGGRALASLIACTSICLVPSILFGVSFPLLSELWIRRRDEIGRGVGLVYLVSTLGGVVGSAAATFYLAPRFGLEACIAALALASVIVGAVFLVCRGSRRSSAILMAAACVLMGTLLFRRGELPEFVSTSASTRDQVQRMFSREPWNPQAIWGGVFLYGDEAMDPDRKVVSVHDGTACSVAVWNENEHISLSVNGKVDASGGGDMGTQLLLAYLPQVLHPDPQEVFVLGYGAGVTAGAAASYGSNVLCAEIEQGVLDASSHFSNVNFDAHDHERVDLRVEDGRSLLRRGDTRYDVITTEPSNPWMAGMSSLFTREFYLLCRERMAEDGILCQWVQLYWSAPEDYRAIAATIRSVFPHVGLFRSTFGDTLMVASAAPLDVGFEHLEARLDARPVVRETLVEHLELMKPGAGEATAFFASTVLLHGPDLDAYVAGEPRRITDDNPFLEFSAARRMKSNSTPEILASLFSHRQADPYGWDSLQGRLTESQRAWLLRYLGVQFLSHDLLEPADRDLTAAFELQPRMVDLAFQRWTLALRRGDEGATGPMVDAMLRQEPGRGLPAAQELSKNGHHDRALELIRRQRRAVGPSKELEQRRAEILERKGDRDAALDAYREALRFNRNDPDLQNAIERLSGERP